jgi:hypothetical protein
MNLKFKTRYSNSNTHSHACTYVKKKLADLSYNYVVIDTALD